MWIHTSTANRQVADEIFVVHCGISQAARSEVSVGIKISYRSIKHEFLCREFAQTLRLSLLRTVRVCMDSD